MSLIKTFWASVPGISVMYSISFGKGGSAHCHDHGVAEASPDSIGDKVVIHDGN